jgi:hypothetical protein
VSPIGDISKVASKVGAKIRAKKTLRIENLCKLPLVISPMKTAFLKC